MQRSLQMLLKIGTMFVPALPTTQGSEPVALVPSAAISERHGGCTS
jgi:hypothetical protein